MKTLRLISAAAALVLLSAGTVSAQDTKTDQTPGASAAQQSVPAAQQSAPADKMAPAVKSDRTVPEKTGQATPTAPESNNKQQMTDKGAAAGAAAKGSSDAQGSADVTSRRTAHHGGAHYAARRHGPFYDSYRGDRGYYGCRHHYHHGWLPWLGC